jgi:Fur family ferric uptake transcriptional regulator
MKRINQAEKANFTALLEAEGDDRLQERIHVIDVFMGTEGHLTLEELFLLLKQEGHEYEPAFLRQCMEMMVQLGFAHKKEFKGQPVRYEHRHLGIHHDHLICTKCGKICEFHNPELEALQEKIAADNCFYMLQHRMEIYGICDECLTPRRALVPLSMAKEGENLVVRKISGGAIAKTRLTAMGLRMGERLEVIGNSGSGQVIIARKGSRLALGRGIAQKVMVSREQDVCKVSGTPSQESS